MSDPQAPGRRDSRANTGAVGRSAVLVLIGVAFGIALFALAGRLDWVEGWLLTGAVLAYMTGGAIVGTARDPELVKERSAAISGARGIERAILVLVLVLCASTIVVGALDAGRFRWSAVPVAIEALGWLLVLPALALPTWVGIVNTYASAVVRVQQERGHHVISGGPYRCVRHPMYLGMVLLGMGVPLALGSWWSLAPGLLWSITFVLRTAQEDSVLQRELPGYAEYATRTRYRLLPGVW